ncbi:MAG: gfo/Idh/MocA family oxidoreductase, partial [Chitinophagaceae bacterium]
RGWWDFGTGAIGDMACHIVGPVFKVLGLQYPTEVYSSVSTPYVNNWTPAYYPKSGPVSSSSHLKFIGKDGQEVSLSWMDGGMQPERPTELGANEAMGDPDGSNGVIFIGTKGKMMCGTYGQYPQLLPTSRTSEVNVPQKYPRVPGGANGHYGQWVEACLAGYHQDYPGNAAMGPDDEKAYVDSPFTSYAVPLTESVLMANLAIRSFNYRVPNAKGDGYNYPGRGITLQWNAQNLKVSNFDAANQYIKRTYRQGWPELKF